MNSMGTDIHAVIEYEDEYGMVKAFADGELEIPRDYNLFCALAFGDGGLVETILYPPRGLPSEYSDTVREAYFFFVRDSEDETRGARTGWSITREQADEWVREGYSSYIDVDWKQRAYVNSPDLHTASYLNCHEIKAALKHYKLDIQMLSPVFQATLAAMDALSKTYGPEKVRLVFWFDN